MIYLLPSRLLRRHIAGCAHHHTAPCIQTLHSRLLRAAELREPEVEHLHQPVVARHDVLRLDVTVSDPGLVRGCERGCRLRRYFQRLAQPDPPMWSALHSLA